MDKLRYELHWMDPTSNKHRKYIIMEVRRIKEYSVSHIELQAYAENMEDYISPIFANFLGRLQGLEIGLLKEGFTHGEYNRLQEPE